MLHAPTSENKTGTESSRTQQAEPEMELERQVHPFGLGWSARQSSVGSGESATTRFGQRRVQLGKMQQAYGNQAVLRMMGRSPNVTASPLSQTGVLQRKCACSNSAGLSGTCAECQEKGEESMLAGIQTKLTVSKPGDEYEQEADRIADQVMGMPEPRIQRICPECEEELQRQPMEEEEEEETLQTKPLAEQITPLVQRQAELMEEEDEEMLQTKTASGQPQTVSSSLKNRITALQGGGQPLPQSERAFFEPRFGADFSQVRIHADSRAAEMAQSVNARAFTYGHHIVFGSHQYIPGGQNGERLLAHELVHVMQQQGSLPRIQRTPEIEWERRNREGGVTSLSHLHLILWNFGVNSSELKDAHQRALTQFAGRPWHLHASSEVEIQGHTSESGSERLNAQLSEDRAMCVFDYLVDHGVDENRLWTIGYGEDIPWRTDGTPAAMARNRRVELIRNEPSPSPLIPPPTPPTPHLICGPDITRSLQRVLTDLRSSFRSGQIQMRGEPLEGLEPITDRDRRRACQTIRGLGSGSIIDGAIAWDITDLYLNNTGWLYEEPYLDENNNYICGIPTRGGTPGTESIENSPCGNSVRVGNGCYLAGTVNYALFGEMIGLCQEHFGQRLGLHPILRTHIGLTEMRRLVSIWKRFDRDDPVPPTLWAEAGYLRSIPPSHPVAQNRAHCTGECSEPCERNFSWVWIPIFPFDLDAL